MRLNGALWVHLDLACIFCHLRLSLHVCFLHHFALMVLEVSPRKLSCWWLCQICKCCSFSPVSILYHEVKWCALGLFGPCSNLPSLTLESAYPLLAPLCSHGSGRGVEKFSDINICGTGPTYSISFYFCCLVISFFSPFAIKLFTAVIFFQKSELQW